MSNDMDLCTSYKKFIQDLPQLLADKGPNRYMPCTKPRITAACARAGSARKSNEWPALHLTGAIRGSFG